MAIIKGFTSLEQSKKLAEILPLESADMYYDVDSYGIQTTPEVLMTSVVRKKDIPCWSLAALINILPDTITDEDGTVFSLNIKKNFIEYYNPSMGALYATYHSIMTEDLVDACYEMIIKLYEQNIL